MGSFWFKFNRYGKDFYVMPSIGETFVCWFILQHLKGYNPFVTKITFEKEFIGSLWLVDI